MSTPVIQQLLQDFNQQNNSQNFTEASSTMVKNLLSELESCYKNKKNAQDSERLQSLLEEVSMFLTLHREVMKAATKTTRN
jgi:hypothetical protein